MAYDAFISYSHKADGKIAPSLQHALKYLAKPWYRFKSLNVFRDETNLSASADLTGAIRKALSSSRYFVYLASPEAATSRWVGEEIEVWRKRNLPENLLIALTGGEIEWDTGRQSFNWENSNALHPKLKGIFSREPLWVDLRWAKTDRNLSPRDPRFQHATAMLAAPISGRTLDELIGEDVRQHRRTRILLGIVVGALSLLLTASIVATRIATTTNQNLQSKLTLIDYVLPFFNLGETDSEETGGKYPLFNRLWSKIRHNLVKPTEEMEEWIQWGADRLALADDCFSSRKEEQGGGFDCPKLKDSFDEDGLRTDIPGLKAIASVFVDSLNNGRMNQLLMHTRAEDFGRTEREPEQLVEEDLDTVFVHARILIPDRLLKQVKRDSEGYKQVQDLSSRRYFQIWRKPLDGAGVSAELILIRFTDSAYCGSRGCNSPTLGFLRVGGTFELALAVVSSETTAVYNAGRGNMPQIFTALATQSGAFYQYREMFRYGFDGDCLCYKPYLAGTVTSFKSGSDQKVPRQLDRAKGEE